MILTPTWAKEDMHEDGIAEGPCELIANEESYIVNICKISYPHGALRIYITKYEARYDCAEIENILHPAPNDDGICSVKEYDYDIRTGKINGWSFYTVQKTK